MKNLYIITGFLGAGKTTFLKKLFSAFSDKKIAVIVNEFGAVGVDGDILKNEGIENIEITNGSIFCVCKKDKFLESLDMAYNTDADYVFVETSGLSDPTDTDNVLLQFQSIYGKTYNLLGIIGIVDCRNFHKVCSTSISVKAQVAAADLLIINKTDLADSNQCLALSQQLTFINPTAKIIKTTFGNILSEEILSINHTKKINGILKNDLLNGKLCFELDKPIKYEKLMEFLNLYSARSYRIKGFVETTEGDFHIECVVGEISTLEKIDFISKSYLVVLYNANENLKNVKFDFYE